MYETHQKLPLPVYQKQARKALKLLYEAIPETEGCMENIARVGGCGAWCCQHQSPQVMLSEFLNTWNTVKHSWKNEDITALLVRCAANYLNNSPTKGCVFWDKETKLCQQHQTRPYNCRTYGQIPDEEFKPRYERLKVLYADKPDAVLREQCSLVKTKGSQSPTAQETHQWFNELFMIEAQMGVRPNMIHGEVGGTYRTYHDHVLLMLAPVSMIATLNKLKASGTEEEKQKYLKKIGERISE